VGKTLIVDKYLVTVVAVKGSGTISFVDGGSAQAATGGVDAWLRGGGLPVASGTTSVGRWEWGRLSWRACLYAPHLLYIAPARQGPTTQLGWAPPTKEPSQGPNSVVGPSRWRSILIFSPLISPLYFKLLNLNLTLYFFFSCFAIGLILLQIST